MRMKIRRGDSLWRRLRMSCCRVRICWVTTPEIRLKVIFDEEEWSNFI